MSKVFFNDNDNDVDDYDYDYHLTNDMFRLVYYVIFFSQRINNKIQLIKLVK